MSEEDRRYPIVLSDIDSAPTNLPSRGQPDDQDRYASLLEKFAVLAEENVHLKQDAIELTKRIKISEVLDSLIKPYADKSFVSMVCYCVFAGAMTVLSGYGPFGFHISPDVLKILIGSTAVTVIGLVGMVLTGIFVGARKN